MNIQILGTRGNIESSKPYHSRHTGILINEEILVDVGEREFLDKNPKAVIFTHLHPDHAFFIENQEEFDPDIPVYAPERNKYISNVNVVDDEFEVKGYSITPVPVIHSLKVKSLGYCIEIESKKIFISGDVAWIEKQYHDKIKGADAIITEASFIRKGGRIRRKDDQIYGHTGIPDLIRIFNPLTEKLVFTHYGSWFVQDVPNGRSKINNLAPENTQLVPAYDGMQIEI